MTTLAFTPRRVAVVRMLQLGDMLVAVPALRTLRAGFPRAEITLIGLPWAESFARRYKGYVDRFVPFQGYPGIAEAPYDAERTACFLAAQRAYGYDLAVQMHGSGGDSNPFALDLGARVTAGYYAGPRAPDGLDPAAPYPDALPEVVRCLGLARLLDCHDPGSGLEFPLGEADRAEAARLLAPLGQKDGPWVALHPGARSPARRWPPARFAAVADHLIRDHDARIIVTGSADEAETARQVAEALPLTHPSRKRDPTPLPQGERGSEIVAPLSRAPEEGLGVRGLRSPLRVLNLTARTSLGGLAAVLARMDLFIGNDTGPAHLAEAVGTPTVRVFGPADPLRWAPLDRRRHPIVRHPVACSPCAFWECPIDHRCLLLLDPARVVAVARDLLEKGVTDQCSA